MKKHTLSTLSALSLLAVMSLVSCGQSSHATYKLNDKAESVTYANARKSRGYKGDLSSTGKTLILPIEFTDYPHTALPSETRESDGVRKDIEKVNFGTAEETQWQSLASFYKASSYGKANLTGAVAPWFNPIGESRGSEYYRLPITARGFAEEHPGYAGAGVALYQAIDSLKSTGYAQMKKSDGTAYTSGDELFKDFDTDKDGFIDNIQLVYTCEPHVKDSKGTIDDQLFWAFRTTTSATPSLDSPKPYNYLWLSFETFYENGYYKNGVYTNWTDQDIIDGTAKLDAHTLIHETGHALGLEDYYTETSRDYSAAGGFLMMDMNVGDHDPFSKAAYGWTNPTVVLDSTEITIKPFQENGDSIIIPAKGQWSYDGETNTLCDEYLMLEYYTPTGLNKYDSTQKYSKVYPMGPKASGLKVWHIDARLGSFKYSSTAGAYLFQKYETKLLNLGDQGFVYMAHFNDVSDSKAAKVPNDYKLIETMRKDGKVAAAGATFDENYLWGQGETFGAGSSWKDYTFHNEKKFGYTINVSAMSETEMTLKISAI
jgi:M6 family metalloprotease-like protein